jgi:hypothetical protein
MKLPRRQFLHLAAGAAALPAVSRIAIAQAYPSRPITIVVPFVAGGPSDLLGRMVGDRFRSSFGQPVVVENVPGANGSIGVGRVARAAPDGYTLVIGLWKQVSPVLCKNVPDDLLCDGLLRRQEQVVHHRIVAVLHRQRIRDILEAGDVLQSVPKSRDDGII